MNFSNEEWADIHFCYGLSNGNSLLARRLYEQRYPARRLPNARTFDSIHRRLRETGQFAVHRFDAGRNPVVWNVDLEEAVLDRAERNPEISTRLLAAEFGTSNMTIWRILHGNNLYPYHVQRVQALYDGDRERRMDYCRWFLNQPRFRYENFAWNILFTDEAQFTRDGITNFHNQHFWEPENPHAIVEGHHQRRFSCNVWGGIVGQYLLGPVFLPPRLNRYSYREFLLNTLPIVMEEIPIKRRQRMWFLHDGAPAHFAPEVRQILNRRDYFGNRWIGRGGPNAWPARSPDLNPLDFFLWGHCKSLVYARRVDTVDELEDRIVDAFQTIRETPGIFQRVNESMYRRLDACLLANGGHFEQLL